MLTENHGYNKPPEIKMVTVITVGKKYVTVCNDIRFQDVGWQDNCLVEDRDWGDHRRLFTDENALNEYLEKKKLITWFRKSESKFEQLSLDKMREIHEIVEGTELKIIALNIDRDGTCYVRHFMVPETTPDDICAMVEKARQNAIHDGCIGWLSEMPASYFDSTDVGFHIMDVMNVVIDDVGLAETEFEKNGYFIPVCKDCNHYLRGFCNRYDGKTDPADVEDCFCNDDTVFYEIHGCYKGGDRLLVRFYRKKQNRKLHHSAEDIFKMFASIHENFSDMLKQSDFHLYELYLTDEDGNALPETESNPSFLTP